MLFIAKNRNSQLFYTYIYIYISGHIIIIIMMNRVRVANELGAGRGKAAKFATVISVTQSTIIGIIFCVLIMVFGDKFAMIFTSSADVLRTVDNIAYLLAFTILLNSVQPVLSGVAVGSGWQAKVAYINLGCYYLLGVPLGVVTGYVFKTGVEVIL